MSDPQIKVEIMPKQVRGEEVCDFCDGRPVIWEYTVRPNEAIVLVGLSVNEVEMTASVDEWIACAQCKALIDADDGDGLLLRSMTNIMPPIKNLGGHLAAMQRLFLESRDGPGHPFR